MSFDLASFAREVPNTSGEFDYYENNNRRFSAAVCWQGGQSRPGAVDHTPGIEVVPLPAPGDILIFSGAHLHKSIPNTSGLARYSVDFRTVDIRDLTAGRCASRGREVHRNIHPRFHQRQGRELVRRGTGPVHLRRTAGGGTLGIHHEGRKPGSEGGLTFQS